MARVESEIEAGSAEENPVEVELVARAIADMGEENGRDLATKIVRLLRLYRSGKLLAGAPTDDAGMPVYLRDDHPRWKRGDVTGRAEFHVAWKQAIPRGVGRSFMWKYEEASFTLYGNDVESMREHNSRLDYLRQRMRWTLGDLVAVLNSDAPLPVLGADILQRRDDGSFEMPAHQIMMLALEAA